jgi:hypothetical protein
VAAERLASRTPASWLEILAALLDLRAVLARYRFLEPPDEADAGSASTRATWASAGNPSAQIGKA